MRVGRLVTTRTVIHARAHRAVVQAAQRPKLDIAAELTGPAGSPNGLHVTAPAGPSGGDVFLAVVYDPQPSAVARGENSGRRLTHISVVKSLKRIGELGRNKVLDIRVTVPPEPHGAELLPNQRLVIFIQERGQGRVLGSAEVNPRQSAGTVARWSPQK